MNDVVQLSMSGMVSLASIAAEAMVSQVVYFGSV